MLLCGLQDVQPGAVLGAVVSDPRLPGHDLLRPGVALDAPMIATLRKRGVGQVWIEDDFTADLDAAVAPRLTAERTRMYSALRDGLSACAKGAITLTDVKSHREAVLGLVLEAMSSAKYASLTDALFSAPEGDHAAHGTNVAYLALLTGLHIEQYVVGEQTRLDRKQARDMSVLGLAGLLHDIGKTKLPPRIARRHEVGREGDDPPEGYDRHTLLGQKLLEGTGAPARVAHAVLNHHQRFDGSGWPSLSSVAAGGLPKPLAGKRIHIVARIVSAANVLDNLLRLASAEGKPPVAALHEFASARFDGWFDPVVRRAMLLRLPPFAVGSDVRLSDGRRAVVIEPSAVEPCRPKVRVLPAADATAAEPCTIDLREARDVSVAFSVGVDVREYLYEVATPSEKRASGVS